MILFSIQLCIFSILLIFFTDRIILFFKESLTTPKIKDLINLTPKKYEEMLNTINTNTQKNNSNIIKEEKNNNLETQNMKEKLKSFLKKQLQNNDNHLENYSSSNNNSIQFSLFSNYVVILVFIFHPY